LDVLVKLAFKNAGIDEAYKKLKNYLKVRPRHLSRADTLDANLAVLGIEQGRRDSFDRRDIQRGSDISATLPTGEEDLPSDVKGIAQSRWKLFGVLLSFFYF
jgi:hypothetical protein